MKENGNFTFHLGDPHHLKKKKREKRIFGRALSKSKYNISSIYTPRTLGLLYFQEPKNKKIRKPQIAQRKQNIGQEIAKCIE